MFCRLPANRREPLREFLLVRVHRQKTEADGEEKTETDDNDETKMNFFIRNHLLNFVLAAVHALVHVYVTVGLNFRVLKR